ncbi:MAG: crotonase/enoyl-CoA hydratase family protein [Acidobacteria bacterium]|nr:crotonase/enoyl-CoA hydratase family protein [Acidobacteriota bacterium]
MTAAPTFASLEVDLDTQAGTAVVRLMGPGKGNAMGKDFWRELPEAFAWLSAHDDVRAVVVTGSGGNFSVGLDLKEMIPQWSEALGPGSFAAARTGLLTDIRSMQAAVTSVAQCRKPVIAAISGWCIGAGVDLISAVDVRVASADAVFSIREVKLGIVADVGSLQRLEGIIGQGQLRELALTGSDFDTARAEQISLVNDVLPDADAALAAAVKLAEVMSANPPLALYGTKEILNEEREERILRGLRHVSAWNAAFLPSEDLQEALAAFAQRRRPLYTGK